MKQRNPKRGSFFIAQKGERRGIKKQDNQEPDNTNDLAAYPALRIMVFADIIQVVCYN